MTEAGLFQQSARGIDMMLVNEQTPRQDADRAFQHAHILVEHEMRDIGRIQQSLERGNQHGVVSANNLAQNSSPSVSDPRPCPVPSAANRRSAWPPVCPA